MLAILNQFPTIVVVLSAPYLLKKRFTQEEKKAVATSEFDKQILAF
jgi:hypothetical protein